MTPPGLRKCSLRSLRKKSHSSTPPQQALGLVSIEANLMGGDEVESFVESWLVLVRFNSKARPGHAPKRDHVPIELIVREIDAVNVVAKVFAAIQEVAGATAEIQHRGLYLAPMKSTKTQDTYLNGSHVVNLAKP
jgi:hypothetical protein